MWLLDVATLYGSFRYSDVVRPGVNVHGLKERWRFGPGLVSSATFTPERRVFRTYRNTRL